MNRSVLRPRGPAFVAKPGIRREVVEELRRGQELGIVIAQVDVIEAGPLECLMWPGMSIRRARAGDR